MSTLSAAGRAVFVLVVVAAAALPAACASHESAPSGPIANPGRIRTATTDSAVPKGDALTLARKAFPLQNVRCVVFGDAVMVGAKTQAGETVMIDTEHGKVGAMSFKADGVEYFWEPTSAGGAPDPVLVKAGNTNTLTERVKQLNALVFTATCPG